MILQSVKCSCCKQQPSSLINLTVFLDKVCCVCFLRKGSCLEEVPEWCCNGMMPGNVWVKAGCPGQPAWQSLSNRRCKVCGRVFEARVSMHPAAVSSVCGVGDWFVGECGTELQSSTTPVALAALKLWLRVILLSACSCWLWKHNKHYVVCAHCIVLPQRLLSEIMASETYSSSSETVLSVFHIFLVNSLFVQELVKYSQNVNLFIGTPFLRSRLPKMQFLCSLEHLWLGREVAKTK